MAAKSGKKTSKTKRASIPMKKTLVFELYGLILLAFFLITLSKFGWFGGTFAWMFRFLTGTWDFILPLIGIFCSVSIMIRREWPYFLTPRWVGFYTVIFSILLFDHLFWFDQLSAQGRFVDQNILSITWDAILQEKAQLQRGLASTTDVGGGMIGGLALTVHYYLFARTGTFIIASVLFLIGLMLLFQISYVRLFSGFKQLADRSLQTISTKGKEAFMLVQESQESKRSTAKSDAHKEVEDFHSTTLESEPSEPLIRDFTEVVYEQDPYPEVMEHSPTTRHQQQDPPKAANPDEIKPIAYRESTEVIQEEPALHYRIPNLSLLKKVKQGKQQGRELRDIQSNARKLEQTLESFGVQARVLQIHRGPTVTRYELQPAVGVKVSKIVNLTDDIALALAARGIRIEAPIPGKSAIGIEVPNTEVAVVTLREVLETGNYLDAEGKLFVGLGRDISGEPIIANLAKMPHLLVAGATGSGKSVCINGIITSLLFKAKPHEVKLMMIDPKMVELNNYNGIPHLLSPVVTDPRRASMALKKVVSEMEKRYELFAKNGTRDIERYNQLVATTGVGNPLPFIVVIVDELADLMMVAANDVEDAICRLAQMARAAGIHLIIATQRPSVDVITGVIKANIPSRIAFGVSSMADSRTILDMGGAEKLLGRGDMLYLPMGASKPVRVQGAFVSDAEVEAVVEFVKDQMEPRYHDFVIPQEAESKSVAHTEDELYEEAVKLVIEAQTASSSLLQRRFRIGYTRAARLIDLMEANKIVGQFEGSKPREVLIKKNESSIS
jgi:S-DNA-T family DNA segregation ATPase FtsK/SpoIIIE